MGCWWVQRCTSWGPIEAWSRREVDASRDSQQSGPPQEADRVPNDFRQELVASTGDGLHALILLRLRPVAVPVTMSRLASTHLPSGQEVSVEDGFGFAVG